MALLRDLGVRRFSALPYAHKPGVATYLNDWARYLRRRGAGDRCGRRRSSRSPRRRRTSAALVDEGVEVFKVHVQVGAFHLDDPLLDDVWERLEASRAPRSWCTPGRARCPTRSPGPSRSRGCWPGGPRLAVVVAHLGAPEYDEFLSLAERSSGCTSTPRWCSRTSSRSCRRSRRRCCRGSSTSGDKVLLGSDFPTIPYPYLHQLESLARLDLGEEWLRAVCWDNGVRLFGMNGARHSPLDWGHNSRGADRFRLGTLVPGEAGRGASVIS